MAKQKFSTLIADNQATAKALNAAIGAPVNVKHYGAVGDGVTDDTNAIKAALAASNKVFFPIGKYLVTSQLVAAGSAVATKDVHLIGEHCSRHNEDASAVIVADVPSGTELFFIGDTTYLTDLVAGGNTWRIENLYFKEQSSVANRLFLNYGVRKFQVEHCYVNGFLTAFEIEASWSNSYIKNTTVQQQRSNGISIRKRCNLFLLDKVGILTNVGDGARGLDISSDGAETKNITLRQVDIEGRGSTVNSQAALEIRGNVGPITLIDCWFENNIYKNLSVLNNLSNMGPINIFGGQFTGVPSDIGNVGGLTVLGGCIVGAELVDADLTINNTTVRDFMISSLRPASEDRITWVGNPPQINDSYSLPPHRIMPMYSGIPAVPTVSSDAKGVTGEIRTNENFIYYKNGSGWLRSQGGRFESSSVPDLGSGATPSAYGLKNCKTKNTGATTITNIINGYSGQELVIVGSDSGNTTIDNSINIKVSSAITLGDNDTITLLNVGGVWLETARSNN